MGLFTKQKHKNTEEQKTKPPKTQKKKRAKKTPFCILANTPPFLVKFCFFFKLHSFMYAKLCFSENTIGIVFSAEHSF